MGSYVSGLHEMLASLEVQKDATRINAIVNHPAVKPWVDGGNETLDLSEVVTRDDTIILLGEHGGVLFHQHLPGTWVAHTQVLPEGRGAWAMLATQACVHWFFTHTDATELLTMCPKGNLAARTLAKLIGLRYETTKQNGWVLNGKVVPVDWYGFRVQDWLATAPGMTERGQWFRERVNMQAGELVIYDDLSQDRALGALYEMAIAGQPAKAMFFYNRWASITDHRPTAVIADNPLTFDVQRAHVILRKNGDIFVALVEEP